MPETIGNRAQVRGAISLVSEDGDRNLGNTHLVACRFDDHLDAEFETCCPYVDLLQQLSTEATDSAVRIVDRGTVDEPDQPRNEWVADVTVAPRHRAALHLSRKPIPDHEVVPLTQLLEDSRNVVVVVLAVRIGEDHKASSCVSRPPAHCAAVSSDSHMHDASASGSGDLGRSVRGAVVSHDDLPGQLTSVQNLAGVTHAMLDGAHLVETRDDDGQLNGPRHAPVG